VVKSTGSLVVLSNGRFVGLFVGRLVRWLIFRTVGWFFGQFLVIKSAVSKVDLTDGRLLEDLFVNSVEFLLGWVRAG
jgi:hypothetical protein